MKLNCRYCKTTQATQWIVNDSETLEDLKCFDCWLQSQNTEESEDET